MYGLFDCGCGSRVEVVDLRAVSDLPRERRLHPVSDLRPTREESAPAMTTPTAASCAIAVVVVSPSSLRTAMSRCCTRSLASGWRGRRTGRYAFAGVRRDTAAVRLRRLFDGRFRAVLPPEQGKENVYRPGLPGRRSSPRTGSWQVASPGAASNITSRSSQRVAVAGIEEFGWRALPDWEIREQFRTTELHVVPDLFLLVRAGERQHAVAVEVDRGTESLAVLNRKVEAYRSLWGAGTRAVRVRPLRDCRRMPRAVRRARSPRNSRKHGSFLMQSG